MFCAQHQFEQKICHKTRRILRIVFLLLANYCLKLRNKKSISGSSNHIAPSGPTSRIVQSDRSFRTNKSDCPTRSLLQDQQVESSSQIARTNLLSVQTNQIFPKDLLSVQTNQIFITGLLSVQTNQIFPMDLLSVQTNQIYPTDLLSVQTNQIFPTDLLFRTSQSDCLDGRRPRILPRYQVTRMVTDRTSDERRKYFS